MERELERPSAASQLKQGARCFTSVTTSFTTRLLLLSYAVLIALLLANSTAALRRFSPGESEVPAALLTLLLALLLASSALLALLLANSRERPFSAALQGKRGAHCFTSFTTRFTGSKASQREQAAAYACILPKP